eukprot:TRINITY_DN95084_c0_g1_i1.p1 TRINITY_DN95084_c0_g1~~TRINITY_DN95084_c0_g1_i1.p1  ORF type:complete len:403 (-),score=174.76 TRINITY_DN95084_c0_g1_i1:53-1261(-)
MLTKAEEVDSEAMLAEESAAAKTDQTVGWRDRVPVAVAAGLLMGFVFGLALEKTKVYVPQVIREQMLFRNWTMIKVFVTSTAVGTLVIGTLEHFGHIQRKCKAPVPLGLGLMKGHGGNVVGGLLLGIGMTLTGACPGTVLAQLGAGLTSAWWVMAGAMVGVFVFAYAHRWLVEASQKRFMNADGQECSTVDGLAHKPVWAVSLAMAAAMAGLVVLINHLQPWQDDILPIVHNPGAMKQVDLDPSATVWSPIVGGIIIGLLQVPSFLVMRTAIGTSSSYVTICGYICGVDPQRSDRAPYFTKFTNGAPKNLWQLALVVAVVLGSLTSAQLSDVSLDLSAGAIAEQHPAVSFFGGMLLLWGARLAGGCTSGHGISGMAQLCIASMVSVVAMFAGAIATAFAVYY